MWRKIQGWFRRLEGEVEEQFRDVPPHPQELLAEILHQVEGKITLVAERRRGFPFALLTIHLVAPDGERQAIFNANYLERDKLLESVRRHLREKECPVPARLAVELNFTAASGPQWLHRWVQVECSAGAGDTASHAVSAAFVPAVLTVLQGQAQREIYDLDEPRRVNIGRMEVVYDAQGLPRRRNEVVFLDDQTEVNRSVGREHAHLRFDEETSTWRLSADSRNSNTNILRAGGTIKVAAGSRRGERLLSGDEIMCGRALLRFELKSSDEAE